MRLHPTVLQVNTKPFSFPCPSVRAEGLNFLELSVHTEEGCQHEDGHVFEAELFLHKQDLPWSWFETQKANASEINWEVLSFNGTCTHHCRKKGDILSGIELPTDLKYTSFSLHYNLSRTVQFKESLHHAWEQSGINQAASGAGLMWNYAWDLSNRKDGSLKQLKILRNYPKKKIYTGECRFAAQPP